MLLGIDDADALAELLLNDPYRLEQVRVVRHENRDIVLTLEAVPEQMRREVHVGALLLGLDHLDRLPWVRGQRHGNDVRQKVSLVDREILGGSERDRIPSVDAQVGHLLL